MIKIETHTNMIIKEVPSTRFNQIITDEML